ncbi:hypothetical protein FHS42_003900 [Streptomyces zagrosensis]|uniref:Uncharacterized protein n=1 Tax=Streptomyces zagrosensis TaxID=1042984 RepID=A0A7W9QBP7_9ACTN|nr:hypothetical protein [Streptomyces zagrosensis]
MLGLRKDIRPIPCYRADPFVRRAHHLDLSSNGLCETALTPVREAPRSTRHKETKARKIQEENSCDPCAQRHI